METNILDITNAAMTVTMDGAASFGAADTGLMALMAGAGLIMMIVPLVIGLIILISGFKILSKAGLPAFGAIVPIWNSMLYWQAGGKSPILGLVAAFIFPMQLALPFLLAKQFGKGAGFGVGMLLLPIIFYPILAFGSAEHASQSDGDEDDGGGRRKKGKKGKKGKKSKKEKGAQKEAPKGLILWVLFAVVIVGALIAILVLQYQEYTYYFGTPEAPGNVWPDSGRYADPW